MNAWREELNQALVHGLRFDDDDNDFEDKFFF